MPVNDPAVVFEFNMRAAEADREGYYITRWDRARSVTARGKTKQEAINKAAKMLGEPRRGRYWTFVVHDATEVEDAERIQRAQAGHDRVYDENRALRVELAEAKAAALREAKEAYLSEFGTWGGAGVGAWLGERAIRIERGV